MMVWSVSALGNPKTGLVIANTECGRALKKPRLEVYMTRSRYGMLAGIAGAAFAAWWWRGRTTARRIDTGSDRGEVIFRNTPEPSGLGGGPT